MKKHPSPDIFITYIQRVVADRLVKVQVKDFIGESPEVAVDVLGYKAMVRLPSSDLIKSMGGKRTPLNLLDYNIASNIVEALVDVIENSYLKKHKKRKI